MYTLFQIGKKTIFLCGLPILVAIIAQCQDFPNPEKTQSNDISVIREWKLPKILDEISGIAYLSENKLACVQDELGMVFIFDTNSNKIVNKIDFGEKGDYEGIAMVENTLFILRSDGSLVELNHFKTQNSPKIKFHASPLPKGNDWEGLTFDNKGNRLLLSIKENKKETQNKEIYAFNLETKTFQKEPIVNLEFPFKDENLKFRPSEIAWTTKGLFVLTSKNPAMIRYENSEPKEVFFLNEDQFPQPEGLTFGENGKIFLSSEGSPGKIFQIELQNK